MGEDRVAQHLSIFLENKPGKLERITKILADSGINIRAFSVASAGEYGILKVLVDDPAKACTLLTAEKITAACKYVLAVAVDDTPGGLHNLLIALSDNDINIDDSYGFVLADKATAVILLEIAETTAGEAAAVLLEKGFHLYSVQELYALP